MYEHGETIGSILEEVAAFNIPCLVVNDGSSAPSRKLLERAAAGHETVQVLHLPENKGKGFAVGKGLFWAREAGCTHAVQLDADSQHTVSDIPAFLAAAKQDPEALILGKPIFGPEAPKCRLYGRHISVFWVMIETLSRAISDPLCGFRCYPVDAVVKVLRKSGTGLRMEFDPEIAVRLFWEGIRIRNIPPRVSYPEGGVSHFHTLRDNVRISWMHTRLVFGMLLRIPRLLVNRTGT